MRIIHAMRRDEALCGLYIFNDGFMFAIDEKAAAIISSNGIVIDSWWKEEPTSSQRWETIMKYNGPIVEMPGRANDDHPSPFEALCFGLTRLKIGDETGEKPLPS